MKIAIISDIHEDYISLLRAAKLIEQHKCDQVFCLGDIVGYSVPYYQYLDTRDANGCVRWVREHCSQVVAGNHDLFAVRKLPVSRVRGFSFPEDWYSLPYRERMALSGGDLWLYEDNELSALLDDDASEYLSTLPETVTAEIGGVSCLLTHFIDPDITGSARQFLVQFSDLADHFRFMKENGCTLSFTGHMHSEGLVKTYLHHDLNAKGFNRKVRLSSFDWVGLPSVSNSKNPNGFLIWDTAHHSVEAVPLRKKISML